MKPTLRNRLLLWGGVVIVLVLDQLTKAWVVKTLPFGIPTNPWPGLKPILSFTYVTNTGVVFGLFPQLGEIFKFLSIVVIVGIVFFQRTLPPEDWVTYMALGLQIGGALGNLTDRLFRGAVVDFLDVNFWPFERWAIFNIADSSIVVGVTILIINMLWLEQRNALALQQNARETWEEETSLNG